MKYNTKNLKPFSKGYDPRRSKGRPKGALNRRTVVKRLLEQEIDPKLLISPQARLAAQQLEGKTNLEALSITLLNEALSGRMRAMKLLLDIEKEAEPTSTFYEDCKFEIEVISPDPEIRRMVEEGL